MVSSAEPAAQARIQPLNIYSAPGTAPEGLRRRGPGPGNDTALRPRVSITGGELSAHMRSMSLAEASTHDSMEDLDIQVSLPPQPDRAQRMQSVAQRVATVESAQETLMRRIDAQVQQTFAKRTEYILLPAAPFDGLFEANADNRSSRFRPLLQAALDHTAAARQWREVADHHAVALGAAQRFGVADVQRTATEAIAFCEATAIRLEMVSHMLAALATSRLGLSAAEGGNFRALELTTDALRTVIDQGREHGFQALQAAGFVPQLQQIAEDAGAHLRRAGTVRDANLAVLVPLAFRAASQVPVWQARTAAAALELLQVAGSLHAAMQGDSQALASRATPLPALLMSAAKAEERATRQTPAQDHEQVLGAWIAALDAHADLPHAVAQASARLQVDALQAQGVQALRQHVDQGLDRAIGQVRGALEASVDALQKELRASDASAGDGDLQPLQAAARNLARRAEQLQERVAGDAVLQRPELRHALEPSALARPFAVVQQAAQAVAQAAAQFGRAEAAALQRVAAEAHAAATAPGAPASKPMAALAAYCSQLAQDVTSARMTILMAPAQIEHESAKEFLRQARQASLPAGHQLETLLMGLDGSLAAAPAGNADRSQIEQLQAIAREAGSRAAVVTLRGDAPAQAQATQRATALMLRATSVAAGAMAESLAYVSRRCTSFLRWRRSSALAWRRASPNVLVQRVPPLVRHWPSRSTSTPTGSPSTWLTSQASKVPSFAMPNG